MLSPEPCGWSAQACRQNPFICVLSFVYIMALGAPVEARLCHGGGGSFLVHARGRRAAARTTRGGRTHRIQINCPWDTWCINDTAVTMFFKILV